MISLEHSKSKTINLDHRIVPEFKNDCCFPKAYTINYTTLQIQIQAQVQIQIQIKYKINIQLQMSKTAPSQILDKFTFAVAPLSFEELVME